MIDKKPIQKQSYLFAFILGIVFMIVLYILFDLTTKSGYRTMVVGDVDVDTNPETGQIYYEDSTYAPIIKTSREEDTTSSSAFLGVEVMPLDPVIAKQLNINSQDGVLISSVIPGSPAHQAGLKRGDLIIAVNNRTVKDIDRFKQIIAELNPGDRVRIVYIREAKKTSTYAVLGEFSAFQEIAQTQDLPSSDWGVSLSPLSAALRDSFNIPSDISGVMVLSVSPGGPADEAGLMPGDVITGIDKTPVAAMDDFFQAIFSDKDTTALLDIYSQGRMRYLPIDSSSIMVTDQLQTQTTLRQRLFSIFTGGAPFTSDEDEEEGPKGGKFAQDDIELTADNTAFNRPSTVPGDVNTGGAGPSDITGFNRPSMVPPQSGGPNNDIVLFVGLLLLALVYLAYREFNRPAELD